MCAHEAILKKQSNIKNEWENVSTIHWILILSLQVSNRGGFGIHFKSTFWKSGSCWGSTVFSLFTILHNACVKNTNKCSTLSCLPQFKTWSIIFHQLKECANINILFVRISVVMMTPLVLWNGKIHKNPSWQKPLIYGMLKHEGWERAADLNFRYHSK